MREWFKSLFEQKKYEIPYYERKSDLAGTPLATFQRRAVAMIIDVVICMAILLVALVIGGWLWWYREFEFILSSYILIYFNQSWFVQLLVDIALPALYFGLLTYFLNGQTLGKRFMRIRVVSLKSDRIRFFQSFDRAFGLTYSTLTLFFGFLRFFDNPVNQTRHDYTANTIVVDEREGWE